MARVSLCLNLIASIHLVGCSLYERDPYVVELDGTPIEKIEPRAQGCPVILELYADWCGHCRRYRPIYSALAKQVEERGELFAYIIAAVDCAFHYGFCKTADVQYYPQFKEFTVGSNSSSFKEVTRSRDSAGMLMSVSSSNQDFVKRVGLEFALTCAHARHTLQSYNKRSGFVSPMRFPDQNRIWLLDLRYGLHQTLLDAMLHMSSNRTQAFDAFLQLAADAFPDESVRLQLASETIPFLRNSNYVVEYPREFLEWLKPTPRSSGHKFLGCRGSLPIFRGETCALWQLFHALLVNSNSTPHATPHTGLSAIVGWVDNFFSCEACRKHFMAMATRDAWKSVDSDDSAVLWLWKAHNAVNRRLAGDATEDPKWPKRQFPSRTACANCWNGTVFDEPQVLSFLRRLYGEDVDASDEDDKERISDTGYDYWGWGEFALVAAMLVALLLFAFNNKQREEQEDVEMTRLENRVVLIS
eukprot:TRINITY_DN23342_c0_g1_i1.p1 TRINITY_DN23342_c0_g1~~TRINITY_DN23342_c0_g1_i1.p1  ORF type:complete len:471 (+),score=52.82 TRINITY_DN23342_c0_g1_i1:91-1503(+)